MSVDGPPGTAAWLPGSGEVVRRSRAHDWTSTPLGSLDAWPEGLLTVVELMLASGFPAAIQLGPEGIDLYDDAPSRSRSRPTLATLVPRSSIRPEAREG